MSKGENTKLFFNPIPILRGLFQCFPVYTILLALGNPTVHYFSLDIDGPELQVLRTIPLDKVDIKIFDIEINHLGEGSFMNIFTR